MFPSDYRVSYAHTADGARLALTEVRPISPDLSVSPALLVHGFAQTRDAFLAGPIPRQLAARGVRTFVAELRGHGRSRMDLGGRAFSGRQTLFDHLHRDLPALIAHVLEQTGAVRLHYMGHSMGGLLGLARLAELPPFCSVTAWATPLLLGASRPAVGLSARAVLPFLRHSRQVVPMRSLLAGLSGLATYPARAGLRRAVGRWLGLANPDLARRDLLRDLLSQSENESGQIMRQLARLSTTKRPRLCDVDLLSAVRRWPGRLAFVVGTHDIFAAPRSVSPVLSLDQAGPRRLLAIEGGHHVDVVVGRRVATVFDELAAFIRA